MSEFMNSSVISSNSQGTSNHCLKIRVPDSDLQIKGGGGRGLGASVWSRNKGVGVGGPPLDPPLRFVEPG